MRADPDLEDNSLAAFLRARRQLVSPDEVGLKAGSNRRVSGLRREEVAALAGVSVAYYVRLEQGHDRSPSDDVLNALARTLKLDPDASAYLRAITRPQFGARPDPAHDSVRPPIRRFVERQETPAYVVNGALDVLTANEHAGRLHPSFRTGRNIVRDLFLERWAQDRYADPGLIQREVVASLRSGAGRDPESPRLQELVEELSQVSAHFHHLWRRHEVWTKTDSTKEFIQPDTGRLTLSYEAFQVAGAPGQQLVVYQLL